MFMKKMMFPGSKTTRSSIFNNEAVRNLLGNQDFSIPKTNKRKKFKYK